MRIKSPIFMILFTSIVLITQIPIITAELQRYPDIRLEFKPYGWGEVEQRINKITVGQRLVLEVTIRNIGKDSITLDSSGVRLGIYIEGPRGFEEQEYWPPVRSEWGYLYLPPKSEIIIYVPLGELLWDTEQIPDSALGKWWKVYLTLDDHVLNTLVYGTPNPLEFEVAQEITLSEKASAYSVEITMVSIGLTVLGIIMTLRKKIKKIFPWRIMVVKRRRQGKNLS